MLIESIHKEISKSSSIISFETESADTYRAWDRFLLVDGKKAFHIGNVCGTCEFFFERLEGANQSINSQETVNALNSGLTNIDRKILNNLEKIIPKGKYIVLLSEQTPKLTSPCKEDDYFSKEQIDSWGVDGFWGMPHHPRTEYYRLSDFKIDQNNGFFDFIIPMFPQNWLEPERVEFYQSSLKNNIKPTCVSIGILDIKEPSDWVDEESIKTHWCLANYLIDGHHKVYAAALEKKPITMISFIALDQGVSSEDDFKKLIKAMKNIKA